MSPAYRLETLLRLRETALEEAQRDLAERALCRSRNEEALEASLERFREAVAEQSHWGRKARDALGEPFQGAQWQRHQDYGRRLAAQVEHRRLEVAEATQALSRTSTAEREARDALVLARQELEILEKDRAAHEAEGRRQRALREEAEAEDLAIGRRGRK